MKKLQLLSLPVLVAATIACAHAAGAPAAAAPKLILVVAVDGLPNEQIQRYRHQFGEGGFKRLMEQGAMFSNAHQAHGTTVTAIGHTAVLTGAYPYQHGIIGNDWIDQASQDKMYCTEDRAHSYIGEKTEPGDGTSPKNLRVGTFGDELRYVTGNQARVFGVSGKDRGAILLAGKTGTAYMYMTRSGNFASSTYYMAAHPQWVQKYNAGRPQDRYYGMPWQALLPEAAYVRDAGPQPQLRSWMGNQFPLQLTSDTGKPDAAFYEHLRTTPFVDQLTLDFAKRLVAEEGLGKNPAGVPDLLAVSFSAHDLINHDFGPESKMSHDHLLRLDRMLADLFGYLDKQLGADSTLVVLTADHGFQNIPEFAQSRQFDAGRIPGKDLLAALDKHLADKFSLDKLLRTSLLPHVYLDYERAARAGIGRTELEDTAARFLLGRPGVAQVYTRTMFEKGAYNGTRQDLLMRRAWNRQMSGDLMVIVKTGWYYSTSQGGTSHGTPYAYDTSVPLLIMGKPWIKPGYYGQYAEVVDIAPTLSHLMRQRWPAGAEGRVLVETLR